MNCSYRKLELQTENIVAPVRFSVISFGIDSVKNCVVTQDLSLIQWH